jgi:hypothetical protein
MIFSKRVDFAIFTVPVIVGLGLSLFFLGERTPKFSMVQTEFILRPALFYHYFILFLDIPHVYATVVRLGVERDQYLKAKILFIGLPLLALLIVSLLAEKNQIWGWRFIAYLNIWHTLRQQWGFVSLSNKKFGTDTKLNRWLDQSAIYLMTLFPVLWLHSQPIDGGWLVVGDIPRLFQGDYIHYFHWAYMVLIACYFAYFFLQSEKQGKVNWTKLNILVTTMVAWYVGIVVMWERTWMIDLQHAVPYLYLVYFYGRKNWGERNKLFQGTAFNVGVKFQVLLIALSVGIYFFPLALNDYLPAGIALGLMMFFPMTHYLLDGFMWKSRRKYNDQYLPTFDLRRS